MLLLETGPTSGVWFDGPTTNGQGTGSLQTDSQKSGLHGFRLSPERQLKLRDSPHATVHPDDVYAITPLRFTLERPLVRTF